MGRPVTLFTGQWADLDCESIIINVEEMGYDGVEFRCWGDHFEVDNAESAYCRAKSQVQITQIWLGEMENPPQPRFRSQAAAGWIKHKA